MSVGVYKKQSLLGGWTRADLLLQIYDRAIASVDACAQASQQQDAAVYTNAFLDAQKAILAIHSGLQPDEHDVAFNVARLLHFVLVSLENKDFDSAARVLQQLRNGFAAVANEVNEMEREGVIPAMPEDDILHA